jgi:hypothetical protein
MLFNMADELEFGLVAARVNFRTDHAVSVLDVALGERNTVNM